MKKTVRLLLVAILSLFITSGAWALSIGTFNVEYFNVSGKKAYSPEDCKHLAETIKSSGADVVALQEIEGNSSMRYFVTKFMPGWKFRGNDTGRKQDLFFLWNSETIDLLSGPVPHYSKFKFKYKKKSIKLFTRPPLEAKFRSKEKDMNFTMVNVHLKSQSTRGKKDQAEAKRYNDAKRASQIEKVNELIEEIKGPVFIAGDYNIDNPQGTDFPLIGLQKKGYSYDNRKSNLDYIGYANIERGKLWNIYEVESAIPARSRKRDQSPDHDMIILSLDGSVLKEESKTTQNDEIIVYITKTGKTYHRASCSYLKKNKIAIPLEKAKGRYKPCSRCKPPE